MLFKGLLALLAATTVASGAFHTELKSSMPAKNSSGASPTKVTLTFTEDVNVAVSAIAILKSDSTEVAKLLVKATSDAATIEGAVIKPLAAGKYLVRYRTASADGHAVRGSFGFTVAAKP
jgi:methionine-rich copper-binding protein CopC